MAGKYIYSWDKERGKKVYGGKYGALNSPRKRVFDVDEERERQQQSPQQNLDDTREVQMPQTHIYEFSDRVHGTRRIVAESYKKALAQAKLWGFEDRDYQGEKRRRGRRR